LKSVLLNIIDSLIHKFSKEIKSRLWCLYNQYNTLDTDHVTFPVIDVVMPIVVKDLQIAKLSIESLKKYSLNPIDKIFVVAPNENAIKVFCKENSLVFIDEDKVSPLDSATISNYIPSISRVGWLKQQLIKLNCFQIPGIKSNVLVMDADTILVKKQFFCKDNNEIILFFSDEFHFYYRLSNRFLLGRYSFFPFSFISHHQVFNTEHLISLTTLLEKLHNDKWYNTFLTAASVYNSFVSEYELYAQYVTQFTDSKYTPQYWFNNNLVHQNYVEAVKYRSRSLSVSYHNFSFH
jgi:hypothetical protein